MTLYRLQELIVRVLKIFDDGDQVTRVLGSAGGQ